MFFLFVFCFLCHQILSVYSREENVGEELLSRVHMGRYRSDGYVWHATVEEVSACVFDWF